MRRPGARRPAGVAVEVAAGERLLASAGLVGGGSIGGTRDAVYLSDVAAAGRPRRIPWEQVHDASWESEEEVLVLSLADGGVARCRMIEPTRFLQLLRERVTNSVVLQRHVPISGRRGVRVAVRRAGSGVLFVTDTLDAGLDGHDDGVRSAVARARADIAAEVGLSDVG